MYRTVFGCELVSGLAHGAEEEADERGQCRCTTYRVVDDVLRPRVVVYVDCHAAERGYFCRQLLEPGVVLALALVGFGHCGGYEASEVI